MSKFGRYDSMSTDYGDGALLKLPAESPSNYNAIKQKRLAEADSLDSLARSLIHVDPKEAGRLRGQAHKLREGYGIYW